MKQVTPLRLYGPGDLAHLEGCASTVVSAWAQQWLFGRDHAVAVQAAPFAGRQMGRRLRCLGDPAGAWLGRCRQDAPSLAGALFGKPLPAAARSKFVVRVADQAAEALTQALLTAMLGQESAAAATSWKRAADDEESTAPLGMVQMRIAVAGAALQMVASAAACVEVLKKRAPAAERAASAPLSQRQVAITGAAVGLRASLAEAEIGLSELVSMRPGDVVLFPHSLADPVFVKTQDGRAVGRAVLGARDGRRAAQFTERNPR